MADRALKAVSPIDLETGEITCPACKTHEDHIAGLQRDIRAEHMRFERLKRDKEREAKESPYWPFIYRLFKYWRKACGKSARYKFKTDRFEIALEHVREDPLLCIEAIAGGAYDPYVAPPGKNGKRIPQNDWSQIFKDSKKVHWFADRAPRDWKPPKGFIEALEQEGWKPS